MRDDRVIVLYLDNDVYVAKSFGPNELDLVRLKISEIRRSRNKRLLWLVNGNLLNVTPNGDIYGW